jgi:Zn-dependent peptidase ImmA (M78 family)
MTPAAQLASLLLEHLGISGKPDLQVLCKSLGLRIREVPLTGAHGALVRSKNAQKGIISVKSTLPERTQKRFTIAHEIGHFIIPYHKNLGSVCEASAVGRFTKTMPRPELEANEFAAELLLPAKIVRGPLQLNSPSLDTIARVASDFDASLTATTWRFLDLTDEPCTMVWSQDGNAIWYRNSDALPIPLPLEELPAPESIAGRIFKGRGASGCGLVDAHLWFRSSDAEKIRSLVEESLHLPSYGAVLTLLWATKVTQCLVDDEQEELLPELAPEGFSLKRERWPH